MKRRTFRDPRQAAMYDVMLLRGDPRRRGAGHWNAFACGYHGDLTPQRTYPRDTLSYAAWAAGVDRRRADAIPAYAERTL